MGLFACQNLLGFRVDGQANTQPTHLLKRAGEKSEFDDQAKRLNGVGGSSRNHPLNVLDKFVDLVGSRMRGRGRGSHRILPQLGGLCQARLDCAERMEDRVMQLPSDATAVVQQGVQSFFGCLERSRKAVSEPDRNRLSALG